MSGQEAFPALPDPPAPAPPAPAPAPPAPAPALPAPVAPVENFQRGGGGCRTTVKYLFLGGEVAHLTINISFRGGGGSIHGFTYGTLSSFNLSFCQVLRTQQTWHQPSVRMGVNAIRPP